MVIEKIEKEIVCSKCNGATFIVNEQNQAEPCPLCYIRRVCKESSIPVRYIKSNSDELKDTEIKSAEKDEILKFIQEFPETTRKTFFFHGVPGTGKTHLACLIAKTVIENEIKKNFVSNPKVLFINLPAFYDEYRDAKYNNEINDKSSREIDDLFKEIETVNLLILDDFGSEKISEWSSEKLYQIIDSRYGASLPTIVTSNHKLRFFEEGKWDERTRMNLLRVVDRLHEDGFHISFTGKSKRREKCEAAV